MLIEEAKSLWTYPDGANPEGLDSKNTTGHQSMMQMSACPAPERLEEFVRDGAVANDLFEHVENCQSCAEIVEHLCSSTCSGSTPTTIMPSLETASPADQLFLAKLAEQLPEGLQGDGLSSRVPFPESMSSDGNLGTVGKYRVLRQIDSGGFGDVYEAFDPQLNRSVALKLLRIADCDDESRVRFQREAQAAGSLRHENVVVLHQVIEPTDEFPYAVLVMEYVRGGSLKQRIENEQGLDIRQVVQWMIQAAQGLAAVHQGGLLHRDLKPANLLLDETNTVKLGDFGLARPLISDTQLSANIAGTPPYMSPEQLLKPDRLTAQSDIYGLGVVFYQLLTGVRPFPGKGEALRKQIIESSPPSIRPLNPQVPKDIETICLRCLHKEPARRFASAQALADDLQRWLGGKPIASRPMSQTEKFQWWIRQNPTLSTIIAGSIMIAVASLLGAWTMNDLRHKELIARQQADANAKLAYDLQIDTFDTLTLLVNKLSVQAMDHSSKITIFEHITTRIEDMNAELARTSDARTTAQSHIRLAMAYDALAPTVNGSKSLLKARDHFVQAIEIVEPLGEPEAPLLLSAYDGLAANAMKRGEIDEAERNFERVADMCAASLTAVPNDPETLRKKSVVLESLSEVAKLRGDVVKRRELLEQCRDIRQDLMQRTDNSRQAKSDLAGVLILLGDCVSKGDATKAAEHYSRSMQLAEELVDMESQNIGYLRSLANACDRYKKVSPESERLDLSKQALAIREKVSRLEPLDRTSLNDLLVSYLGVSDLLSQSGQLAEAERLLGLASEQAERWYDLESDDQRACMFLSRVLLGYNKLYRQQGKTEAALPPTQRAVELRRRALQLSSSANNRQYCLAGLDSLADVLTDLGRNAEAIEVSEEQLELIEQMANAKEFSNDTPTWREGIRQRIESLKDK